MVADSGEEEEEDAQEVEEEPEVEQKGAEEESVFKPQRKQQLQLPYKRSSQDSSHPFKEGHRVKQLAACQAYPRTRIGERQRQVVAGGMEGGLKGKKGEGKDGKGGKKGSVWKEQAAPRVEPTQRKVRPLSWGHEQQFAGACCPYWRPPGSALEVYPWNSEVLSGLFLVIWYSITARRAIARRQGRPPAPARQRASYRDEGDERFQAIMALHPGLQFELPQWWYACRFGQWATYSSTVKQFGTLS